MDIAVFSPQESNMVVRAVRTALRPEGALDTPERLFLQTLARILDCEHEVEPEPRPIDAADVRIADAHRRKRLVQLSAMAALFSHPVRRDSVRYVHDLAAALEVREPVLRVLRALLRGQRLLARALTMKRMLSAVLREAHRAEGVPGVLRFLAGMFLRVAVNRDKTWQYKRLGLLPEGSLGRTFWAHLTSLGYAFPGEPGGIPETMAYHDVAHVLSGYDTTPAGEIRQASFQGGNRRMDGFFFIQFALLQFQQGVRMTPVAKPEVGYFHPVDVLVAIHRGASCPVDVTHGWNYWPLMSLPLTEARALCGVRPAMEIA